MAALEKLALIFLGPQGSGKGTQAISIAKQLKMERFEMGAHLRAIKQRDDEFGHQVKDIVDAGNYIPDWMIERVLSNYFSSNSHQRILFDGIPRTLTQSKIFDQVLAQQGFPAAYIVHITLSRASSFKRLLKRGREDDTPAIIEQRLSNHHRFTGPVIARYQKQNRVIKISGEPPPQEVTQAILGALAEKGIKP